MIKSNTSLMALLMLLSCTHYSTATQQAVLVMGVGKSGTSCVTGILEIMGVYLGDNLRAPGQEFNVKGTFEDLVINRIDQDIFQTVGINTYHAHLVRNIDQLPETQKYKEKIVQYLKKQFKDVPVFGIKSNRMCLLVPLYLSALEKLNCKPKLVIVLRSPEHIATSRMKRWPKHYATKEDAYLHLVVYYMNVIENLAKGIDVHVMYYEDLLNNTQETVNRLQAFIPDLYTYEEAKEAIDTFLEKQLDHSKN